MDKEKRNEIIACCLERGAGMRQLSRLTGVTYGVINRLRGRIMGLCHKDGLKDYYNL